jgi:hypothetical protein
MNKPETVLALILALIVILGIIGGVSSPMDENGRPVLLLPDVREVESYRRQASVWVEDLRRLDGQLATVLAGNSGDLLGQSRAVQGIFEEHLRLVQEIDASNVPPALIGLRELLSNASLSYLEAARGLLRWVSTPDQENRDQAVQLIQSAQKDLSLLESSAWINP